MSGRLSPSWYFKTDGMRGYISGVHEHGIEITGIGSDLRPATRRMCLNVEHYYSRPLLNGRFIPRYKANVRAEQIDDGRIRIEIDPFDEWQVRTIVTYVVRPEDIIEATFEFTFEIDIAGFEAFISNYFHEATEPFIHVGGQWMKPQLTNDEHRFWARGLEEAKTIEAVYQREFINDGVDLPIDDKFYDFPLMVTPVADTGLAIVNFAERKHCSSISANRCWKAHDFSLVGTDVSAGETVICRGWLACRPIEPLDDVIALFLELTGDSD